jgi:hypothetical protein
LAAPRSRLLWAVGASDDELVLASYGQRGKDLLIETPSQRRRWPRTGCCIARDREDSESRSPIPSAAGSSNAIRRSSRSSCVRGVLLQIDATALLARRGARQTQSPRDQTLSRRTGSCDRLGCASGRHVLASSHGARRCSRRRVSEMVGPARAQWMVRVAPAAILAGVALPEPSASR